MVRPPISSENLELLQKNGVPAVSLMDACQGCDDPCYDDEDTHPDQTFGGRLAPGQIDDEFTLLGSIKNSGRTVIVATSKADWPHSVTDEKDLFAYQISQSYEAHLKELDDSSSSSTTNGENGHDSEAATSSGTSITPRHAIQDMDGLGDGLVKDGNERARNMTILCGSMHPYEENHPTTPSGAKRESVFIFPDYKMVTHLPSDDASELVASHLSPRLLTPVSCSQSSSMSELKSYILPYNATILVCSHKKRDRRCHVTADPIISSLRHAIEELGDHWHVDTRGDEESLFEDYLISPSDSSTASNIEAKKRRLMIHNTNTTTTASSPNGKEEEEAEEKHIGIFKVSHVGGHKFAGQVIIWLPNGINIWYGRVTTQDCKVIINECFKNGRMVADLLRGGTGIARRDKSVWEW